MSATEIDLDAATFPRLDLADMERVAKLGERCDFADGDVVLSAGTADVDFVVVETGAIEIRNPANDNELVATHGPRQFVGDVDLLTRRPIIIDAVAKGPTRAIRVPGKKLRRMLLTVPHLGEKLLVAVQLRREQLAASGTLGLRVLGAANCPDTHLIREFLHKNFVPFTWYDIDTKEGELVRASLNADGSTPWVECGRGNVLVRPTVQKIAECAGVWRHCPEGRVDLAIVGAGPAGIAAAVYAASEGLNTVVLDRLGPGGQAGGSSRIENFMGFPSGLSGGELATRGVLQMLKFGAQMVAPVQGMKLESSIDPREPHRLMTGCGSTILADVVLVATGATWKRLKAKNAEKFERVGVHYACTSVESDLYDACDVAVVGAANSAGQAAMFLAETCARRVHMIVRGKSIDASMSQYLADRIRETKNIEIHTGVEIGEVVGTHEVEGILLTGRDGGPRPDGAPERIDVKGVFAFIGADPHSDWLPPEIVRDARGYVLTGAEMVRAGKWPLTDRDPCPLETSVPRILAAGDVRAGSTKRVGFAVGDGSLAVTCTHTIRASIAAARGSKADAASASSSAAR